MSDNRPLPTFRRLYPNYQKSGKRSVDRKSARTIHPKGEASMTTLHERSGRPQTNSNNRGSGAERRRFRRHDLDTQGIAVERWDGARRSAAPFGRIVDLSAGGGRVPTTPPA